METYERTLFVSDTDFTGFLYFTKLQDIGLEVFTSRIQGMGSQVKALFFDSNFLFPIVHAEANYKIPVSLGDTLRCHLEIINIGVTSFSYRIKFYLIGNKEVGDVTIVHVCVDRDSKSKISLPLKINSVILKI